MDIKEIALKVGLQTFEEHPYDKGHVVSPSGYTWIDDKLIEFAEALIAELAKQNEPVAFLHEWIEYHPFGDMFVGEPCATITNDEKPFDSSDTVSPFYTFPPTAEQIANETAEVIAEMCDEQEETYSKDIRTGDLYKATACEFIAKRIRSGEWRKFVKEV